ncbi:glycosyltransferase family 4 protein [Fictibacillus iocasae]|uniref:Glycosyltransferase family 4 protein n=1 Tax=Fictibacillus iocasae TaxID=2715437 RepID=A0ABW2NPP8_9BACL
MGDFIKILIVHNYYKQSGGEDKVVNEEINLLRKNGNKVITFFVKNEEINTDSFLEKIKLGIDTLWSNKSYREIKRILLKEKPDLVHFHNTVPLLSPSVYYACENLKIPVIQTLHNYRLACPSAMLLRDGEVCEKCIEGSLLNSLKYGCYRNSRIQTLPISSMLFTHRLLDTWNSRVDKYIALTNFAKNKFREIGIDENRINVKPNFINQNISKEVIIKENRIVFVGRISKEKGVHLLLEAWNNLSPKIEWKLDIIGDGPLLNKFRSEYGQIDNIQFHGLLKDYNVLDHMAKAKYVIIPSVWYEGFPMTIVESYSVNTPVISSNIGSLKEIVNNGITGFHFDNNDISSLEKVLQKALTYSNYQTMQKNVKHEFESKYTSEVNYKMLINTYKEVIKERKK